MLFPNLSPNTTPPNYVSNVFSLSPKSGRRGNIFVYRTSKSALGEAFRGAKGNHFIYLQVKVIMLFNIFGSTSNYNEYFEGCQYENYSNDGIYPYYFRYLPCILFTPRKPGDNDFFKHDSMGLKKKKNLSDRVVEFVLNCSIEDFQNLTVTKIASAFQVNRCYLSRRFKSEKEFTLCEFLMREKLSRSIILLRQDDQITIRELSVKMGFSNTNYFIQIFKSYFGAPPGRYRDCIAKGLGGK